MRFRGPALVLLALAAPAVASAAPTSTKECIEAAERAQQLRHQGKLVDAHEPLVTCTAPRCPSVVRRDCGRWMEEVEQATPSIVVKLVDESGKEVADGRVLLDGAELHEGEPGRAVKVDPGPHHLAWSRPDHGVDQDFVVHEGERDRLVVLSAKAPDTTASSEPDRAPPEAPQPASSRSAAPWIVGGLGLAAGGVGVALWGFGLSQRATLAGSCAETHSCLESDVNASRTNLVIGDVLVGAGAVAVLAAIYLFFQDGGPPATSATNR